MEEKDKIIVKWVQEDMETSNSLLNNNNNNNNNNILWHIAKDFLSLLEATKSASLAICESNSSLAHIINLYKNPERQFHNCDANVLTSSLY